MDTSINGLDTAQQLLVKLVDENPDDWAIRKKVVSVLYDSGFYVDASKMLWSAPEIPPVTEELVYAVGIVSKGQPSRAIRLLDVIVAQNLAAPEENLNVAKLLMKKGMSYQAIRFYGAATAIDPSIADNDFEMSLLNADMDDTNWNQLVSTSEFPWDGPEAEGEKEVVEEKKEDDLSSLLDGATMPVPLKATPAKRNTLPEASVKPSPRVEDSIAEGPRTVPLKENADTVSQDLGQNNLRVVPTQSVMQKEDSVYNTGRITKELEAAKAKKEAEEAKVTPEPNVVEKPVSEPYFKTAQDVKKPEAVISDAEPEQETVTAEDVKDAVKAIEKSSPAIEQKPQLPDLSTDDESDAPMINTPNKAGRGMLSSLMSKFRGKSKVVTEERINVDDLDLSGVGSSKPVLKGKALPDPTSANPLIKKSVPKVTAAPEASPEPTNSIETGKITANIASKVERPVVDENAGPDVLDGRTQLVALAPEDGGIFFSELVDKYIALESGPMPEAAVIARDMANIDYLDLINKACRKDLGAFSDLLGLHRVMSEANCNDWVDDMNRLRKGFGDAVLATVVSKYSVTECREILNSVYSFPSSSQSAAS